VVGASSIFGVETVAFRRALGAIAAEGTDRGRIIDRALEAVGAASVDVGPLVEAFRMFDLPTLVPYFGVRDGLETLARCVPIALVTDGDPRIQEAKLRALELDDAFSLVLVSDTLGREFRKPHPASLLEAARRLGIAPEECIYVGDRPDKDVAAANAAGMRAVRVRSGEYIWKPDIPQPWMTVSRAGDAISRLLALVREATVRR
jgi:putative hydrolase of the HAD superfamily